MRNVHTELWWEHMSPPSKKNVVLYSWLYNCAYEHTYYILKYNWYSDINNIAYIFILKIRPSHPPPFSRIITRSATAIMLTHVTSPIVYNNIGHWLCTRRDVIYKMCWVSFSPRAAAAIINSAAVFLAGVPPIRTPHRRRPATIIYTAAAYPPVYYRRLVYPPLNTIYTP